MEKKIMDAVYNLIRPLSGFEQAEVVEVSEGHSVISIEIPETSLNSLGNVHGGFLFTLCDISAGIISASHSLVSVTLNGSINYIKGLSGGTLYFEANTLHKGRTTLVVDVKVTDRNKTLISTGTFTMYVLKDF
ncbi:hotdog fold thioesterase [Clostridium sp. MCC353]|uniref:PaaI family thioesterase n=1 Tax=Clostridium sp. MCC353 TaxID=2592646 RepID=UPI001C0365DF|nr:PaaI family thioesterase [Clostridium sp. MCC353]MBT9779547.1 hotdog fold thioesterase [Clostridium sp. MCC353]